MASMTKMMQILKAIKKENLDIIVTVPQGLRLKIPESQKSLIWGPYILNPKTLYPASLTVDQHLLRLHSSC